MNDPNVQPIRSVLRLTNRESGEGSGWFHLSVSQQSGALRGIDHALPAMLLVNNTAISDLQDYIDDHFIVDSQVSMHQVAGIIGHAVPSVKAVADWVQISIQLEAAYNQPTVGLPIHAADEATLVAEDYLEEAPVPPPRVIPLTPLRRLYRHIGMLPWIGVHQVMLEGFLNHPDLLLRLFRSSRNKFWQYANVEPLVPLVRPRLARLDVPHIVGELDLVSMLQNENEGKVDVADRPELCMTFVERQVSPYRTTGGRWEDGRRARDSGAGGIDMLLVNDDDQTPIVAEIKVLTDKNPFYALIQLLTYAVELITPNQYDRMQRWIDTMQYRVNNRPILLPNANDPRIDLYMILVRGPKQHDVPYQSILDGTQQLVEDLYQVECNIFNQAIRRIVCLDASKDAVGLTFNTVFAFGEGL